jgi:glutamyl-tRNA reductase
VASGMDSLIVGEDQVLGQFKRAYEKAMKIKMTGPILNTLSRYAITASKKMKTQIYESKKHNSISKLVVKQLYKCYKEDVHNKSALVIGNGYIGTLILKELSNFGLASLYVTTRNYGYKEENLINNTGVNIIDYEDRYSVIDKCEIIISATSSPHYTITYNLLNKFIDINKEYVFIDLAVPRDFDNTISNINNIRYYNIDSFTLHINELLEDESIDVIYIENVLDKWVKDYCNWFSYKDIVPIIQDTRDYAYEVILNRLDKVINSISYLNDKDRKMIKYSTENIYKIVLNRVLYSIKNYDVTDNMEDYFNKLKKSISNIR